MKDFTKLDTYIDNLFVKQEPLFEELLQGAKELGLPEIHISPIEGKLLYLLAKMSGAKKILEIGTLSGYSALWLSKALPPDGKVVTIEIQKRSAAFATKIFEQAGLSGKIEVRVGNALKLLPTMIQNKEGRFDLIFIDAKKEEYLDYLELVVKLSRPGTVILSDNVLKITDPTKKSHRVVAEFNQKIAEDPRFESIIIPLIDKEIIDGIAITLVTKKID